MIHTTLRFWCTSVIRGTSRWDLTLELSGGKAVRLERDVRHHCARPRRPASPYATQERLEPRSNRRCVPEPKSKASAAQATPPTNSTQARRDRPLFERRRRAVKAARQNITALTRNRTVKIASAGYEMGTLLKMKTETAPKMRVATADRNEATRRSILVGGRLRSSIYEA